MSQYGSNLITSCLNKAFNGKEPWQIVAITTSTVLGTIWLWNLLNQNESIYKRSKKTFFKLARKVPSVRAKVESELEKVRLDFETSAIKNFQGLDFNVELPRQGLKNDEILKKVNEHLQLGDYNWKEGKVSGAVYYYNEELVNLITEVYGRASYTNPLHIDIFPGICKMEAEVVRIAAGLFGGDENACGTMTSGGTESILLACKAYRDYAKDVKGITNPNIVAPTTAHAAFDKAGQFFNIHIKYIPVHPDTMEVDTKAMRRAIDRNTILLVGSVPNFPYGTVDNIEEISNLGEKYKVPVHVDACLGGFIIVFMEKAGYKVRPFGFKLKGVTSISADTHKYGFAPKGSSIILYSNKKYRQHQYTVTTDWPGGVYGSPTINGSRAGGIIAACWATLLSFGEEGYVQSTKRIIETARYIERGLRKIEGIFIFGKPEVTVIGIGSKVFDIFRLSDALCKSGWNLNALQFPSGIHLCVTYMHTLDGAADKFIADVETAVEKLLENPEEIVEGKMAIYGVAQSLPDRTLVGDFTRCFLDSMYFTPSIVNTN